VGLPNLQLHQCIIGASSESIKNEPSAEQRKRIANFEKAEKLKRRADKDKRSAVKSGRKDGKGGGAWD
jgi:peptidyl-tRNA hydrolase ICT1